METIRAFALVADRAPKEGETPIHLDGGLILADERSRLHLYLYEKCAPSPLGWERLVPVTITISK